MIRPGLNAAFGAVIGTAKGTARGGFPGLTKGPQGATSELCESSIRAFNPLGQHSVPRRGKLIRGSQCPARLHVFRKHQVAPGTVSHKETLPEVGEVPPVRAV